MEDKPRFSIKVSKKIGYLWVGGGIATAVFIIVYLYSQIPVNTEAKGFLIETVVILLVATPLIYFLDRRYILKYRKEIPKN